VSPLARRPPHRRVEHKDVGSDRVLYRNLDRYRPRV